MPPSGSLVVTSVTYEQNRDEEFYSLLTDDGELLDLEFGPDSRNTPDAVHVHQGSVVDSSDESNIDPGTRVVVRGRRMNAPGRNPHTRADAIAVRSIGHAVGRDGRTLLQTLPTKYTTMPTLVMVTSYANCDANQANQNTPAEVDAFVFGTLSVSRMLLDADAFRCLDPLAHDVPPLT
jgi:hypothetical protein